MNKTPLEKIKQILHTVAIDHPEEITQLRGGYSKEVYNINGQYILRISPPNEKKVKQNEKANLQKVQHLPTTPKIFAQGRIGDREYILLSYIQGETVFRTWPQKNPQQQKQLVKELISFIKNIHAIPMQSYTIGYHHTALQNWNGTWIQGHDTYMKSLSDKLNAIQFDKQVQDLIKTAFTYYQNNRPALRYQTTPKMLHGDLQLYNIIEEQNHIRGIIDWEWTHGGEIDFDLESLIRWALYPHHPAEKELEPYVFREQYTNLIQLILEEYREIAVLPHLTQRMTIYQIEYDLHRLTQQSQNTKHPKERLQGWLEEKILGKYLPNT